MLCGYKQENEYFTVCAFDNANIFRAVKYLEVLLYGHHNPSSLSYASSMKASTEESLSMCGLAFMLCEC